MAEVVPETAPFIGMLWYGHFAPAGTPPAIVAQLNTTLEACLQDAETRGALRRAGYDDQRLVGQGPAAFRATLEPEIERLRELVRRGNIVLR